MSFQLALSALLADDVPAACRDILDRMRSMHEQLAESGAVRSAAWAREYYAEVESELFHAGHEIAAGRTMDAVDHLDAAYGRLGSLMNHDAVARMQAPGEPPPAS